MSSFLMFRSILDNNRTFKENIKPSLANLNFEREAVHTSEDLGISLRKQVEEVTKDGKAALMLSGGIDSAVLAKYMPKGSIAYTLKCIVPGKDVVDETEIAAKYAQECGLDHRIIEICWDDYLKYAPLLMEQKGAPLHSIEVQIYKAAIQAKQDGFTKLIFGENADIIYGGFSGLLSKDWLFGEFVERYSYILPYKVLKEPKLILDPFKKHEKNGYVDVHGFINDIFRLESLGSYTNACSSGGIEFIGPFSRTYLAEPLDYERVRKGENKYIIRELFKTLYKNFLIPPKIPMPRPTTEWLDAWKGPKRDEFYENCVENMTGDQKWLVFCLEWFLNLLDSQNSLPE